MAQRYQLVSPRPKRDGGTYWHNVGSAFAKDNGSFSLVFDSLPIPDKDGRVMVLMSEARDRNDGGQQRQSGGYGQQSSAPGGGSYGRDMPDSSDIPF